MTTETTALIQDEHRFLVQCVDRGITTPVSVLNTFNSFLGGLVWSGKILPEDKQSCMDSFRRALL